MFTMINTKDFIIRLEKIIDYYGLSASSFAENIGVQRSSISHILSGRNKPSLEFIMKVLSSFPEVDLYWLLNGKGNFPKEDFSENYKNQEKNQNNIKKDIVSRPDHLESEIERIVI